MSEEKKARIVKDYLSDILENIDDINVFIEGLNYEDFKSDKKTQYAVIRCLEVIGEAAKKYQIIRELNIRLFLGRKSVE